MFLANYKNDCRFIVFCIIWWYKLFVKREHTVYFHVLSAAVVCRRHPLKRPDSNGQTWLHVVFSIGCTSHMGRWSRIRKENIICGDIKTNVADKAGLRFSAPWHHSQNNKILKQNRRHNDTIKQDTHLTNIVFKLRPFSANKMFIKNPPIK